MRRIAIAIALIACGSSATPIERAQAAERGHGRTRDYRAAADLYRSACDLGKGDVDACGALIRVQLVGRGAAADRQAAKMLAGTLCMNRRDPFGCTAADISG